MKVLILVVFVATLATVHVGADLTEEQKAKFIQYFTECKESVKITDEELKKLKDGETPEDSKCFTNCILEKFGVMKDGAIQEAAIVENFTPSIGADKAKQLRDNCRGEKGANKCETAYKLDKCFQTNKAIPQ